jgi:hypothetical protein
MRHVYVCCTPFSEEDGHDSCGAGLSETSRHFLTAQMALETPTIKQHSSGNDVGK